MECPIGLLSEIKTTKKSIDVIKGYIE